MMYAQGAVTVEEAVGGKGTSDAPWLGALDRVRPAMLNIGLIVEICLVFLNTVARAFHGESMPGMEETARLFLVCIAFLGGALASGVAAPLLTH
jgi:TRAP-type C4-dicarboxylate transport system permease small subunit